MTPEAIQAILSLPLTGILIYLLVRAEARESELLSQICTMQMQHAKDVLDLSMRFADKFIIDKIS